MDAKWAVTLAPAVTLGNPSASLPLVMTPPTRSESPGFTVGSGGFTRNVCSSMVLSSPRSGDVGPERMASASFVLARVAIDTGSMSLTIPSQNAM